jgi:hypothetical protein
MRIFDSLHLLVGLIILLMILNFIWDVRHRQGTVWSTITYVTGKMTTYICLFATAYQFDKTLKDTSINDPVQLFCTINLLIYEVKTIYSSLQTLGLSWLLQKLHLVKTKPKMDVEQEIKKLEDEIAQLRGEKSWTQD